MNNMPLKVRRECEQDPKYHTCARRAALQDHTCEADPVTRKLIEWEHALYFANKQVQRKFAIVPICWWAHRGPGFVKEINVWLALNQATDEELRSISKAVDYVRERARLNAKYGHYK